MNLPNRVRSATILTVLDRIDCDIVAALQKNARTSNKELAAIVGLAQSTCLERVRRLTAAGVLRGFHADVDLRSIGVGLQAVITLRLRRHSRPLYETLQAHLGSLPEVMSLFRVSGSDDFIVHVAVRDTQHLNDLCIDAFASRDEVAHIETSLVFEHIRSPNAPNYLDAT